MSSVRKVKYAWIAASLGGCAALPGLFGLAGQQPAGPGSSPTPWGTVSPASSTSASQPPGDTASPTPDATPTAPALHALGPVDLSILGITVESSSNYVLQLSRYDLNPGRLVPRASAPTPGPSTYLAYYIWAGESSPSFYIRTYGSGEATHAFVSGPSVYSAFAGKLSAVVGGISGSKAAFGPEGELSAEFAVGTAGPGSIEVVEPGDLILDLRWSSGGIYEAQTRSILPISASPSQTPVGPLTSYSPLVAVSGTNPPAYGRSDSWATATHIGALDLSVPSPWLSAVTFMVGDASPIAVSQPSAGGVHLVFPPGTRGELTATADPASDYFVLSPSAGLGSVTALKTQTSPVALLDLEAALAFRVTTSEGDPVPGLQRRNFQLTYTLPPASGSNNAPSAVVGKLTSFSDEGNGNYRLGAEIPPGFATEESSKVRLDILNGGDSTRSVLALPQ